MHFLRRLDGANGPRLLCFEAWGEVLGSKGPRSRLYPGLCILGNADTGGVAHPVADIDERYHYGTFDRDAGQASGSKGSGVNINPI